MLEFNFPKDEKNSSEPVHGKIFCYFKTSNACETSKHQQAKQKWAPKNLPNPKKLPKEINFARSGHTDAQLPTSFRIGDILHFNKVFIKVMD